MRKILIIALLALAFIPMNALAQESGKYQHPRMTIEEMVATWRADPEVVTSQKRTANQRLVETYSWKTTGRLYPQWWGLLYLFPEGKGDPRVCPMNDNTRLFLSDWDTVPGYWGDVFGVEAGMKVRLRCTTRVVTDESGNILSWGTPRVSVRALSQKG